MSGLITPPHLNVTPAVLDTVAGGANVMPLARGSWLMLLGGGQLGSMFADAAKTLGFHVAAIDPDPDAPIQNHADRTFTASYDNTEVLKQMVGLASVATVEFENIPFSALAFVGGQIPLRPSVDAIATSQDRTEEKALFMRCGLPTTPYALIKTASDLKQVTPGFFPSRLKTTRMGYDGKGQRVVHSEEELKTAFEALGNVPCVLEKQLTLKSEISVLVARDARGLAVTWPVSENFHKDGILDVTIAPARIPDALAKEAREYAKKIAINLGYIGVLCVEFFIAADDRLYLNEIAPRPHNSGHHTIESCITSQFEQQARICGSLPMGDTRQVKPAVMINLLGDLWFASNATEPIEPDWKAAMRDAGTNAALHIYGKKVARKGRKMGHITVTGETQEEAIAMANGIREHLGFPPVGAAPKFHHRKEAPHQLWEMVGK
jgi:5-(carboxyamino)imidazole ribonucleotide synthase